MTVRTKTFHGKKLESALIWVCPKGPCIKRLVPGVALLGDSGLFKRPAGIALGYWEHAFKKLFILFYILCV